MSKFDVHSSITFQALKLKTGKDTAMQLKNSSPNI